jgi:hypothetical protein
MVRHPLVALRILLMDSQSKASSFEAIYFLDIEGLSTAYVNLPRSFSALVPNWGLFSSANYYISFCVIQDDRENPELEIAI